MQTGPVMMRSVGNDRPARLDDMRCDMQPDMRRATTDAVFSLTRSIGRAGPTRRARLDCNLHDRTYLRAHFDTKHATSRR